MRRIFCGLAGLALSAFSHSPAFAADKAGCADSVQVQRFAGADLIDCTNMPSENATLAVKPFDAKTAPTEALKVLGAGTTLVYANPPERSALEINRNFEAVLIANGAQILFSCARETCGVTGQERGLVTDRVKGLNGPYAAKMRDEPGDIRYMAARLKTAAGPSFVWALSVYIAQDRRAYSVVKIVAPEPALAGTALLDRETLSTRLEAEGHAALYGLSFEPGKELLTPAAVPQLQEIAKLLKEEPDLKIVVVGHTEGQGNAARNLEVSRKRAEAVRAALLKLGADPERLDVAGLGALAPVASNRDAAGRAKNRRVEIVERLDSGTLAQTMR